MTYSYLISKVQFLNCISKAVELAISDKASVLVHFLDDVLTIDNAELITSYLDCMSNIYYNFDASANLLNIKALDIQEDSPEIHCHVHKSVENAASKKSSPLHYIDATNNGILN